MVDRFHTAEIEVCVSGQLFRRIKLFSQCGRADNVGKQHRHRLAFVGGSDQAECELQPRFPQTRPCTGQVRAGPADLRFCLTWCNLDLPDSQLDGLAEIPLVLTAHGQALFDHARRIVPRELSPEDRMRFFLE